MFTFTRVAHAVAVAGALSVAGTALAATIQIDNFTKTGTTSTYTTDIAKTDPVAVSITGVPSGELSGLLNGASFQTFCVDIFQGFPGWGAPGSNSTYSLVSGSTQFGSRATDVNRLFTNWYTPLMTEAASTAFQMALWEIVYESGSGYDLAAGTFTATGGSAVGAGAYGLASTMLGNLGSLGPTYMQVDVYHSASYQDFTTVSTVPEPEGYALALASLGVLAAVLRMKRRSAKAASL